jgi:hypothetical protein
MALTEAQADLRRAHVNGGAGVIVSGLAWLAASIVFITAGPRPAFFTLFVCGLAIAPVAQLVTRFVFKAPPSGTGKRLEWIAIATVPVLLAGFYIGWLRLETAPLAAIPIAAIGVGLRYLAFPVMYGGLIFAVLGTAFMAGGAAGLVGPESLAAPIALGLALTELAIGSLLARQWRAGEHAPA